MGKKGTTSFYAIYPKSPCHSGILELQMKASALGGINVTLLFRSHSAAP